MPRNALITRWRTIQCDTTLDFTILNTHIFTSKDQLEVINSNINVKMEEEFEEDFCKENQRYLYITHQVELKDYESLLDGSLSQRTNFLIVLGILSFLLDRVFSSFEFFGGSSKIQEEQKFISREIFILENKDLSNQLYRIKDYIKNNNEAKRRLLFSSLDRWRKACFLDSEDEDSQTHTDEIILSFFHILELLANELFIKKQRNEANILVKSFTEELLEKIFITKGDALSAEIKDKSLLIEKVLLSHIGVKSKILYMLKELNLFNEKLRYFISILVEDRNSVAHGKQAFQNKFFYPVPPFFPLIKKRFYSIDILRLLSARTIDKMLLTSLYEEKWNQIQYEELPASLDDIKLFIDKKEYNNLTCAEFCENKHPISPYDIQHYLLTRKLKPKKVLPLLSKFILESKLTELEVNALIIPTLIISDYLEDDKCIDLIKTASLNSWFSDYFSKMRDILYFIESSGYDLKTMKILLDTKEIK